MIPRGGASLAAWVALCLGAGALAAETDGAAPTEGEAHHLDDPREHEQPGTATIRRRDLGIELLSANERWSLHPWLRLQTRYSDPFDSDPRNPDAFTNEPGSEFEVRRARLKMEGQLGSPNVELYFEHELSGDAPLLDLRLDLFWGEHWQARVGQYKVLYNRERVDSSGKQTFAERSIATYAFTLDRQRGATIGRNWGSGTRADQWLMLGVFEGDGRGSGGDGSDPMFVARWQWAFLGRDLPFSQGDLKFLERPAATLAFGAATVRGPYTRFSSSGGGQLEDYEAGDDDRYRLNQFLQEFAWHYRGWEVQQEYHVKRIHDHESGDDSTLHGGYLQAGKTFNTRWRVRGLPAGLALRVARVDWDDTPEDRVQSELAAVANVYFDGHNNKLTADLSRIGVDMDAGSDADDWRFRLQWDVSF